MRKIMLLTSLINFPVLAVIPSSQFFVGVKGGYQWVLDENHYNLDPEGTNLGLISGLYGGLQLTPLWRWDLGYQYHNELKADATSANTKTWLIESALRYDWHLQNDLSLYGRFGLAYWNMEKMESFSSKNDTAGFSPLSEVGIGYNFDHDFQLSAGYQYIYNIGKGTEKYDSQGLLVSFTYFFGGTAKPELVETAVSPIVKDVPVKEIVTVKPPPQITTTTFSGIAFDSDSIDPSQELTEIASFLKFYSSAKAIVIGHTDSTGSAFYNQKLSERRAQMIVNKLIELEVTPTQLEWQGKGESQPVVNNNTIEERAKNRRVEITIHNL